MDVKGNHTEEISLVIKQPASTVTVLDEAISSNQCHLIVVVVHNFEHVSSLNYRLPIKHIVQKTNNENRFADVGYAAFLKFHNIVSSAFAARYSPYSEIYVSAEAGY